MEWRDFFYARARAYFASTLVRGNSFSFIRRIRRDLYKLS